MFVLASVVGGLATSATVLITARLVKGVTAAFTAPAALSILLHSYDDEAKRHKALGAFLSISAIGFNGGGLMAAGTWRLVLLVPAVLALVLLIMAPVVIPRPEAHAERQRVDVVGALTVTTALMALVYGVSMSSSHGWSSSLTIGSLAAAAVLGTAFVQMQRVRRSPLVPLAIFRRPGLVDRQIKDVVTGHVPSSRRTRYGTTQVLADLPKIAMQPEPHDVSRQGRPHLERQR